VLTGQMFVKDEARSYNPCSCGEARSIIYSECVSMALVIQHTKRARRIILPSAGLCGSGEFFFIFFNIFTLSRKRHDFWPAVGGGVSAEKIF